MSSKPIVVIYHSADFDGIFCREIAKKFLGEQAEYIGWDYGDPVPEVSLDQQLYILDLSIEGLMSHPKLIWIDHHKSAIERYSNDIPGYRLDGVAACRLAWFWFSSWDRFQKQANATMPTFEWFLAHYPFATKQKFIDRLVSEPVAVRLAGEYDVWDKRDPSAEVFQFGLRTVELGEGEWKLLFKQGEEDGVWLVNCLLENGTLAQRYQRGVDAEMMKARSFTVQFEGLNFLALNTARCNSLTFAAAVKPEHDALLGFFWNGSFWKVSLYGVPHRPDLDLSAIAKKHGGGGHRQACGFEAKALPWLDTNSTN